MAKQKKLFSFQHKQNHLIVVFEYILYADK